MRYMFRILVLGKPESSIPYIMNTGVEDGEDQEDIYECYKEIKVFDNICNLEIDVVAKLTADFDEIIPNVDGIIYFLNPMEKREWDLFELLSEIISDVRRGIPIIIFFNSPGRIISIPSNILLEGVWKNYPTYESFINLPPNQFYKVLSTLTESMITSKIPINVENAWMRLSIFISQANTFYQEGKYYESARATECASRVANIYNMDDFFIYGEQASFLYSKAYRYLEASDVLQEIDKEKNLLFKRYYVDNMIAYGNRLFNKNNFDEAAKQYETAGNWASLELEDKEIIQQAYKYAIHSWISATKVENAFIICQKMNRIDKKDILHEITDKINASIDYLISVNKLNTAREQLYLSTNMYQKEGLFEDLKKIVKKLAEVLILIFKDKIKKNDIYSAKETYDEIVNIWNTFIVERVNLDNQLEKIIRSFAEVLNFNMVSLLINELNSLDLKKKLTEFVSEVEDSDRARKKKEQEEFIEHGVEILKEYIKAEKNIFLNTSKEAIDLANHHVSKGKIIQGASILIEQSQLLKHLGEDDLSDDVNMQALNILIEGNFLPEFIYHSKSLKRITKKRYFQGKLLQIINSIESIYNKDGYSKIENYIDKLLRIYRSLLIYEGSTKFSEFCIELIKKYALKIIENNENIKGIKSSLALIQQALYISSSYLDNKIINFDEIYKKIAETYILLEDLSLANTYNQRIENKRYSKIISKKIHKLESKRSALKAEKAEKAVKGELLKEKLSILKQKAKEALSELEGQFKSRKGLKRAYFQTPLMLLNKREYEDSIAAYKDVAIRLTKINQYNLSAISIAVACLILLKENQFEKIPIFINSIRKELKDYAKILFETFPVKIIEYIIEMRKYEDEKRVKEAIGFMKTLPLFEIEKLVLSLYLGEDIDIAAPEMKVERKIIEIPGGKIGQPSIQEGKEIKAGIIRKEKAEIVKKKILLEQNLAKLKQKQIDLRRTVKEVLKKRSALRRRYYNEILDLLNKNDFREAANKYLHVATILIKRKDFENASFIILLWGLCLFKTDQSLQSIKTKLDEILDTLGISKELLKDTFYNLMLSFLIEANLAGENELYELGKKILSRDVLPLFDEEIILIS